MSTPTIVPPAEAADASSVVLSAEGLGKRYRVGETHQQTELLAERVAQFLRHPLRRWQRRARSHGEDTEFWALRDVGFELRRGDALALVGRNGAGKSTLLKILSGVTLPTEGRASVSGRLATLLEVGTGFHPELTGRENVFLNGAILGMRRSEIAARFDDIVEFSGVTRFLDTPVKRYSSGMRVRLGFAVAAHLEPDVLLVDEVLAVGDAEFQRRCLGKMRDVAGEGRGVVFVSHNLTAVQRLCNRALLIEGGRATMDASPTDVVAEYLRSVEPDQASGVAVINDNTPRIGTGQARLRRVRLTDDNGEQITSVYLGQPFRVELTYDVFETLESTTVEIGVSTAEGQRILTAQGIDGDRPPMRFDPGRWTIAARIDATLLPGEFVLDAALHRMDAITTDHVDRVIRFAALNKAEAGGDHYPWQAVRGFARPASTWTTTRVSDADPNADG